MRVKFAEQHLYETDGRKKGRTFKEGEVADLRDDIAERFIRRGVAVKHDAPAERSAPRPPVPPAPPTPPPGGRGDGGKSNEGRSAKENGGKGDGGKP